MVKYELLGYNGSDEYLNYFVTTLIPTNRTFSYYVDWEKIKSNLEKKCYRNKHIELFNTY
jgi:type II restriction enzyme